MKQVLDRNGKPVLVGSRVRTVAIAAFLKRDLPLEEWERVPSSLGEAFEVYEIDNAVELGSRSSSHQHRVNTKVIVSRLHPTRWNFSTSRGSNVRVANKRFNPENENWRASTSLGSAAVNRR
jgi:hypothetical protein